MSPSIKRHGAYKKIKSIFRSSLITKGLIYKPLIVETFDISNLELFNVTEFIV